MKVIVLCNINKIIKCKNIATKVNIQKQLECVKENIACIKDIQLTEYILHNLYCLLGVVLQIFLFFFRLYINVSISTVTKLVLERKKKAIVAIAGARHYIAKIPISQYEF